jgi:hypothetical protein
MTCTRFFPIWTHSVIVINPFLENAHALRLF